VAFAAYAFTLVRRLRSGNPKPATLALTSIPVWAAVAVAGWAVLLRP
jgi:hypothetical protein